MAKQLFNSSEKSNFILNLTEEKYAKIASWGLIAACLLTTIATAIPVIMENKAYILSSTGLAVAGVFCMVLALIAAIKKYISPKLMIPLCAMGFTLVWAIISAINSYDITVAINGYPGRGEGVLAIVYYISFFITASAVKNDKSRKTMLCGILINGIINGIVGVIQVFTHKITDFRYADINIEINSSSGFSQSPLFFAMVMSISTAAALMGAAILKEKKYKIICIVSACLFAFVTMFTYTFIGICGTALAVVVSVIAVFVLKSPKINLLASAAAVAAAVIAVCIVQSGAIPGMEDGYRLYDGRLLWFSDSYTRLTSSGLFNKETLDIDDTEEVYYHLNSRTMDIISTNPILGTGPDQLVYPQVYTYGPFEKDECLLEDILLYNKGTFDRVYNEYLNTAATRGIPSAISFAVTIISVLAIGFGSFKKSRSPLVFCMTMLVLMGALLFLICCSSTAFSPIFWAVAGAAAAELPKKDNA